MEQVITLIQNLSSTKQDQEKLLAQLKDMQDIMLTNLNHLDDFLAMLPANEYGLGHLVLLSVKAVATFEPIMFIDQVTQFLSICSVSQVRLAPEKFHLVCDKFVQACIEVGQPMRAIKPLRQSLWKIGARDLLTPQHQLLLLACIVSKCYRSALSTLDSDSYLIDKKATATTGEHVRLYYYYGGIIYASQKNFARSQEFFIRVLSFPAVVTSAIMIEAYKKFVLVSLILNGTVPSVSQYASNSFARQVKQICGAYAELATSYETGSFLDLQQCAANNEAKFFADGNGGLVKQVIASLGRKNLSGLTKTYLTLSLANISEKIDSPIDQVEKQILSMIEKNEIFAQIDQQTGMVIFKENPTRYNTQETMNLLDRNISYTIDLNNFVSSLDENITTSSEYVHKMLQSSRNKWGPSSGIEESRFEGMPTDFRG